VAFRARQAVADGRGGYSIEERPADGGGFDTHFYSRNITAGRTAHVAFGLYDHRRGRYRIVVRYRTVKARPGPTGSLTWPGLLVGEAYVTVPEPASRRGAR
jgi:hypothetical protein